MTASAPPFRGWPPAALDWFRGLEADNSRAWFQANRRTYDEAVRQPLESLLAEVEDEFGEGKVFRPNRDTRFSKDKTPYKTQLAALVTPASADAGGWYIQLSKEGLFLGGGLYHPERDRLARIRAAIDDERRGAELDAVITGLEASGLELLTEGMVRTTPRGYAKDHPRIDRLRLVNVAAARSEPPRKWLHTAAAKDHIVSAWRAVTPLIEWLAKT